MAQNCERPNSHLCGNTLSLFGQNLSSDPCSSNLQMSKDRCGTCLPPPFRPWKHWNSYANQTALQRGSLRLDLLRYRPASAHEVTVIRIPSTCNALNVAPPIELG